MNKEEFIKKIQSMKGKIEQYKKIEYLTTTTNEEYKKLKKDLKEQIVLEELRDEEDLKYLHGRNISN